MEKKGMLLVISGPSGVGKGTVCRELMKRCPELVLSVSATTRPPRPGEAEGVNYYYKSREEFLRMRQNGEFLESFEIYGNCYGTPKKTVFDLLEQGKDVVLEIDMQGAMAVKEEFANAVLVFILPPSVEELVSRLKGRNTENEQSLQTRTSAARRELEKCKFYDYAVLNDSVENAVCAIIDIVKAERLRPSRRGEMLKQILGGNPL